MRLTRREMLWLTALFPLLSKGESHAQSALPRGLAPGDTFSREALLNHAKTLSSKAFEPSNVPLPDGFTNLNAEAYGKLRYREDARIPLSETDSVLLEPLPRGFVFNHNVQLHTLRNGVITVLPFDGKAFEGGNGVAEPPKNLGFSGFRMYSVAPSGNVPSPYLAFQAATFFRALARGHQWGVQARALVLNVAEAKGEEVPVFRSFWIEHQPTVTTVHALLDSPSTCGVFRADFRSGDATLADIEVSLFPRSELSHVGLAPLTSMFQFAAHDRRGVEDIRPAVHKSNGLQMHTGRGEWIWRTLHNPETLQIASFQDENPRGFGLLQRDRNPDSFLDDDQRFERRTSAWVEPLGDWGQGAVVLLEIPTDTDIHDNIMVYWRPRNSLKVGQGLTMAYRLWWVGEATDKPNLATVKDVRLGRLGQRRRRCYVDMTPPASWSGTPPENLRAELSSHPLVVSPPTWRWLAEKQIMRVMFDFEVGNEPQVELRLTLFADQTPASETWLYRWTP